MTSSLTLGLPFLPSSPLCMVSVMVSVLLTVAALLFAYPKFVFLVYPSVYTFSWPSGLDCRMRSSFRDICDLRGALKRFDMLTIVKSCS
jgi:hypothetical protein